MRLVIRTNGWLHAQRCRRHGAEVLWGHQSVESKAETTTPVLPSFLREVVLCGRVLFGNSLLVFWFVGFDRTVALIFFFTRVFLQLKLVVLMSCVLMTLACLSQVLTSTDPGVKKIRMSFKKSYQGSLNKVGGLVCAAVTPGTKVCPSVTLRLTVKSVWRRVGKKLLLLLLLLD